MAKLTQKQLDVWLKRWQPLLKLADWRIIIQLRRHFAMGEDTDGQSAFTLTKRWAHIVICDPDDKHPDSPWSPDPEQVVVHELLHCHFEPFFPEDRESMEYKSAEQAVDALAWAFVELDRARKS